MALDVDTASLSDPSVVQKEGEIDYDLLVPDDEIDLSDLDFSDLEAKYATPQDKIDGVNDFSSYLVVAGLPIVDEAKAVKLTTHLVKNIIGHEAVSLEAVYMPMEKENSPSSLGYAFITCPSVEVMKTLVKKLDKLPLDKKHTLVAISFDDVDTMLRETTDVFEPPKMQEYPELENIWDWLVDDSGRDQLLAYKDFDISIVWAPNKNAAATVSNLDSNLIKHGKNLTDQFASWSPLGTYLCTAHRQGVLLWTGPSFARFGKYAHTGVSKMFMSPNENYLVTCSREAVPFGQKAYNTFVWDVRTKQVLRGFNIDLLPNPDKTEEIDLANENWPWIKWSADESYLARLVNGFVMIYTLPNMEPFDKKPLNIENVQDFEWSPAAATSGKSAVNVLALWTPEGPNAPARISLIDIPSKRMIRSKNIFSVKSVSICWKNLDFISFQVDRWVGKSKITYYTCFEVFGFDAEKKDVTFIETLELKDKVVSGISWEPQGKRFVLCYKNMEQNGGGAGGAVSTVNSLFSLYEYDSSAVVGSQVKLVKSLSRSKNLDTMLWSPKGRVLLLAASNGEGLLEFWNVPRDAASSMELMASQEHYLMSSVMWDPSGRYVTSIAQAKSRSSSETGYTIYDFKGLAIEKVSVPHLKQCLWRPRLPTLLSNSQLKKIRKDLAKYSTIFTEQDQSRKNKANLATSMHLLKMQEEWATWAKAWKKQLAEEMPERNLLLFGDRAGAGVRMEEEFEDIQEIVEELLEETIEDAPEE